MDNASAWEASLRGGKSSDEVVWRSPKVSPSQTHQLNLPEIVLFFFSDELSTRNVNYFFLRLKKCT